MTCWPSTSANLRVDAADGLIGNDVVAVLGLAAEDDARFVERQDLVRGPAFEHAKRRHAAPSSGGESETHTRFYGGAANGARMVGTIVRRGKGIDPGSECRAPAVAAGPDETAFTTSTRTA